MSSSRLRISVALLAALAALVFVSRETRISPATNGSSATATTAPASEAASATEQKIDRPVDEARSIAEKPPARSPDAIRADALAKAAAFTDWLTAWRRADSAGQPALAASGLALAVDRRASLKQLIQVDPRLVLELAVPVGLRPELPADVQAQLERRVDQRGNLEVTIGCFGPTTQLNRTALIAGQVYETFVYGRRDQQHTKFGLPLHGIAIDEVFALSEVPFRELDDGEKAANNLASDAIAVSIGGEIKTLASAAELEQLSRELIAAESKEGPHVANLGTPDPGGAGTPPTAATTPWVLGAKRVLWVKVDFADDPGGFAGDDQIAATNAQVSEFYAANSQGRTTISFAVLPAVLRLPRSKAVYNASSSTVTQLQSDAAALAKAYDAANGGAGTYDPDRYDRWIVLFKRVPAYAFGGQAQVGGPQVRMNGTIAAGTTAHELGHTQGLRHSHYWLPSGSVSLSAGAHVEYGDVFDNMGGANSSANNHFNAAQKAQLGYLDATSTTTVTQPGTYRIARHDHSDAAAIRGLKIAPADFEYEYWIEHRRFGPSAFNAAQLERLRNGVLLHWGQGKAPRFTTGPGTYLVDATPGSAGAASDAPLRTGETFTDPDAGITIRPLSAGGTAPNEYIDVEIAFGATGGNRNPTIEAEVPTGTLAARTNIIFKARASDPDGDAVYYRWDFGDRRIDPPLDNITRRFTKGGAYSLRVSAHDGKGGVAAKTFALNVEDPLLTWTARSSGVTSTLHCALHAAGKFIVGGDATLIHSNDGITWTRAAAPTTNSYRGLAYNGTRFVAVGLGPNPNARGGAAYSEDGDNWAAGTLPAGVGTLTGVAHGAGRFVAVGETGRIYSSVDGTSWTEVAAPVPNNLRAIAFAEDLFVVTGDSGRLLTSTDGLTWTNKSVATSNALLTVTRHAGAWYALSSTLECFTSTDGVAWTRIATSGRTNPTLRIISAGGLLFAATANGSVAFAEDVRLWSTHQIDATPSTNFQGAIEGDGMIVIVGSRGLIHTAAVPPATAPPIPAPSLRNEADSLKVSVGRNNVLAAGGTGFTKLELYANGTKVSELNGTSGALSWTPSSIGNYSLVVRGIDASGASVVSAAVPAVSAFANWISTNLKPTGADLRGAVRVDNKWWIVGGVGSFFTLDDNGTFDRVDFPTSQHLTSIAYANGRFLVSGPFFDAGAREEIGSLWTSTDGYSWTPLLTTTFDNFNLNFVTHGGGKWLAASTGGALLTSTDGVSWARQVSGVPTSLRRGTFGNNTWVLVGAGGRILTSPDATTWLPRTSGITTDLASVAFHEGTFVACGAGGVILSSNDGITWTRRNSGVTGVLNSVANVNGTWVVAGDTAGVRTSTDLATWTPASLENNTITSLFVTGSGGEGIVLGRSGNVFTTSNAISWKRMTAGTTESRFAVIYAAGRFVSVGQITDTITRNAGAPIFTSVDGIRWARPAPNSDFASLNAVTYGQQRFVAVGASRVFSSADGVTWTRQSFDFTSTLSAVTAGPDGFVAASQGGFIYSSPNGATWTQRPTGQTDPLRAAAYGNGRYVVVGDGGTVLHSTDRDTWAAASSGVAASLLTVGYFENVGFLAAGNAGTMINSVDGITWQQVETGTSDNITAVARTPVGFVAAGGTNGTILVSVDAANWSVATIPADRVIRGIAASPSAVVAVGDNGTALTFELVDSTPPPVILAQPASRTASPGDTVIFSVSAQNASGAVYQWLKDGVPIVGANAPVYAIPVATNARAGDYAVSVTTATGTITSSAATLSFGAVADPGRLINLSILTSLASASDSFTFGVVVGGTGTTGGKPLLVRAVGPSLAALNVGGVLEDPKLEFFSGATKVGENDNWGGAAAITATMAQVGAFPFIGAASRDAAISLPSLASGASSARISGTGAGTVIAELYDATPSGSFTAATPRLVNVSVLKHIGTGVTAGFVVGGSSARRILVRAIGPTLGTAPFLVDGVVADPQLGLFRGETRVGSNDDWGGTSALSAAFAQVGAFALPNNSRDAALLADLQPGSYTVQVSGAAGASGTALIEIYEIP